MPSGKGIVHDTEDQGANNIIGYVQVESMQNMHGTNGKFDYSKEIVYKPYLKKGNGANLQIGQQVTFEIKKASISIHGEPGVASHIWVLIID